MRDFTRRDFLNLSGASALALALAACGSSGGGAPATATEAQMESVVNDYLKGKGLNELKHEDLLAEYAKVSAAVCKAHDSEYDTFEPTAAELEKMTAAERNLMESGHFSEDTVSETLPIGLFPESETELSAQLAAYETDLRHNQRYIGTAATTIKGKPIGSSSLSAKKRPTPPDPPKHKFMMPDF